MIQYFFQRLKWKEQTRIGIGIIDYLPLKRGAYNTCLFHIAPVKQEIADICCGDVWIVGSMRMQ